MAAGGWLAGAIYDYAGFYAAAFAAGIIANLANLAITKGHEMALRHRHRNTAQKAAPIIALPRVTGMPRSLASFAG
jgi:hypothetical protein